MGLTLSGIFTKLFSKKQVRMLMVGLDGAGKTTILYKLKFGDTLATIPTIGFNVEMIEYKNLTFTVWDIGGQDKIRCLWRHYFQNTDALIFVVDSSDKDRINEASKELHSLITEYELRNVILLVLANKQDLPISMTVSEISEKLELSKLKNRKWHIHGTCALRGTGLYDGFEWLSRELC